MARAFAKGYDPVLELAQATSKESDGSTKKGIIRRKEQDYIDAVIDGKVSGECEPGRFEGFGGHRVWFGLTRYTLL